MRVAAEFIWIRHEFPWLGDGFIHAVHVDAADDFVRRLRGFDFEIFEMGLSAMSIFDQLADAYTFPDYSGRNWAAVNDSLGDVNPPARSALVWRGADSAAADDPKTFAEACCTLLPVFDSWSADGRQAVLVLVGQGPGFRHP